MKLSGRAWLEFEATPDGSGSAIRQTAIYDPVGLGGLAYWYSLYPVHQLIFSGMLRRIAKAAVAKTNQSVPLTMEVVLTPDQAGRGGRVQIHLPIEAACSTCGGSVPIMGLVDRNNRRTTGFGARKSINDSLRAKG